MDLIEQIRERNHGDPAAAAQELGRGLMRGRSADMQLGYTWANAVLAAGEAFVLDREGMLRLGVYLHGFAEGMKSADTTDLAEVFRRGLRAGHEEDRQRINPAA